MWGETSSFRNKMKSLWSIFQRCKSISKVKEKNYFPQWREILGISNRVFIERKKIVFSHTQENKMKKRLGSNYELDNSTLFNKGILALTLSVCVYVVCMYVCMCVYACVCIYICVCVCVCVCVWSFN